MSPANMDIEIPEALAAYLHERPELADNPALEFVQLDGGVSNRTMWVKRQQPPDWILKQALSKLRVAVDWFSSPARIHREAAGLRWLGRILPGHVPAFVFEDIQHHVLAMTAIPQPHHNWKTLLLAGQIEGDHVRQFAQLLATIHSARGTYPELATEFADRGFFESLRLEPYYLYTAEQVPAARDFLRRLVNDTRTRQHALVHGDYSPKNVLVHDNRLYILDYEVIHFGDPAFDVGFSLTHLLSKAHVVRSHRDTFFQMAQRYWTTYAAAAGSPGTEDLERYTVRHTLACLLARVDGRSPLEYLSGEHQDRQRAIVLALMADPPESVISLIQMFEQKVQQADVKN